MFTIAVVNQKGGSGKSTLAQCLAVAAYLDDKGVAILDIDPQGSAYKWAQRRKEKDRSRTRGLRINISDLS